MRIGDGLWLRILDVEGALSARSYAEEGELVLELVDSLVPENAGLWRLEARDGGAEVERGTGEPALRLDVQALASVFLGGFSFASSRRRVSWRSSRTGRGDRGRVLSDTARALVPRGLLNRSH